MISFIKPIKRVKDLIIEKLDALVESQNNLDFQYKRSQEDISQLREQTSHLISQVSYLREQLTEGKYYKDEVHTLHYQVSSSSQGLLPIPIPVKILYRQWLEEAFSDFYGLNGDSDYEVFIDKLASDTPNWLSQYVLSYSDKSARKSFAEALVTACFNASKLNIDHRKLPKLKQEYSIGLPIQILLVFIDYLSELKISKNDSTVAIAQKIYDEIPETNSYYSRIVSIVLGEFQLKNKQYDDAIGLAKKSLASNSLCLTSQDLLYRACKAKVEAGGSLGQDDVVALYDLKDRFCPKPFETLVAGYGGNSFLCSCAAWLPVGVGNVLNDESHDDIWNSEAAQEIRRSVLEGDFSYCSRTLCPFIKQNSLPKKSEITDPQMRQYIDNKTVEVPEAPKLFVLAYDRSCNLACPSCRSEVIAANAKEQETMNQALKRVILPLLEKMDGRCFMTSDGDPFASKHYRSILANLTKSQYPNLKVSILTNGLMLSPKMWDSLSGVELVDRIFVSIDAATPETYAQVRYPGNFANLLPNLEFLGSLRREKVIDTLSFNFVVQSKNFREMKEFVQLGLDIGVTTIHFQRMLNVTSSPNEQFLLNDVGDPSNPHYQELLEITSDPIFDEDIVDLYTLIPSRSKRTDLKGKQFS